MFYLILEFNQLSGFNGYPPIEIVKLKISTKVCFSNIVTRTQNPKPKTEPLKCEFERQLILSVNCTILGLILKSCHVFNTVQAFSNTYSNVSQSQFGSITRSLNTI